MLELVYMETDRLAQEAVYARNTNDTCNTAANMFWKIPPNQQLINAIN